MFFQYFSRQILFSRTFQDSPVFKYFQACANPELFKKLVWVLLSTHNIFCLEDKIFFNNVILSKDL